MNCFSLMCGEVIIFTFFFCVVELLWKKPCTFIAQILSPCNTFALKLYTNLWIVGTCLMEDTLTPSL